MPKGKYKRTPEMKTGKYKRTPEMKTGKYEHTSEHNAAISDGLKNSDAVKAKAGAQRDVPLSPEHCAAISKAKTGAPQTPEHSYAITKGYQKNPKVFDNRNKNMQGGNDICDHHVAYDFGRPEALIVKVTRSFHGQIHHPKGCQFGTYGYSLID